MGRNGLFGNFQGFDAFGKVRGQYQCPPSMRAGKLTMGVDNGRCQDPYKDRSSMWVPLSIFAAYFRVWDVADGVVTFISLSIILTSVMLEFIDYRRIHLEPSIIVDRSRGEKLVIEMDVTFPRVPCYRELIDLQDNVDGAEHSVLSLDVMDISGEHQSDLEHDMVKTRLSKDGAELETLKDGRTLISSFNDRSPVDYRADVPLQV